MGKEAERKLQQGLSIKKRTAYICLTVYIKEGANKSTKPVFFIEHLENRQAIHMLRQEDLFAPFLNV